jgi:hypothetical protein
MLLRHKTSQTRIHFWISMTNTTFYGCILFQARGESELTNQNANLRHDVDSLKQQNDYFYSMERDYKTIRSKVRINYITHIYIYRMYQKGALFTYIGCTRRGSLFWINFQREVHSPKKRRYFYLKMKKISVKLK